MKIRTQLIISHTVLTAIAILILAIPAYIMQKKIVQREITQNTELQIEKVNSDISNFILKPQKMVDVVADYLGTFDDLTESEKEVETYLKSEVKGISEYSLLYVADKIPYCNGGYFYSDSHWIPPADFNQETRGWYKNAVSASGKIVFSDPYVDAMSGDLVVGIARAFYKNGTFLGVNSVDLILNNVIDMIRVVKVTESGKSFIVDRNGNYVANEDKSKVGSSFVSDFSFANKILGLNNDIFIDFSDKENYFVAKPLSGNNGNWILVTLGPKSELYVDMQYGLIMIFVVAFIAVCFAVICSIFVALKIRKPLKTVGKALYYISSGEADLTKRINFKSNNEIGVIVNNFNIFVEKLQNIIIGLKNLNDTLKVAGENLEFGTENTTKSISGILDNIDDVHIQISTQSDDVQETSGAVNKIASNIENLEQMIEVQSSGVTKATEAVEKMVSSIEFVNNNISKMADSFGLLQNDTQTGTKKQQIVNEKISQIEAQSELLQEANAAISAIAEQTNLLAMNAAIEAAHAGETGKGFSVVADEIRSLAETSSEQSKTIGDQLLKIRSSIQEVVSSSSESCESFNSVSEKINETDFIVQDISNSMREQNANSQYIITALKEMTSISERVKSSSKEMSNGNTQILKDVNELQDSSLKMNTSMGEMSSNAQRIRDTSHSLSSVASQMHNVIEEINQQISQFKV